MRKIYCWLGFHREMPIDSNLAMPDEVIYRTYMKCEDCGRFGKLVFFDEVKVKKLSPIVEE